MAANPQSHDAPMEVQYDDTCRLCNAVVAFLRRMDRRGVLKFVPLPGTCTLGGQCADSVAVLEGGKRYEKSAAALRIARRLRWPWRAAGALSVMPAGLLDKGYDVIARNRYRWFGRE
jgi:predicted DCC family thiol-disulfide oxidoreductase YuxK